MRHAYVCAFLPGLSPLPDLTLSTDIPQQGKFVFEEYSAMTKEDARNEAAGIVLFEYNSLAKNLKK